MILTGLAFAIIGSVLVFCHDGAGRMNYYSFRSFPASAGPFFDSRSSV